MSVLNGGYNSWCLIDLIKRDVRNGNRDSLSTYQRCLEKIVVNETEDSVLAQQKVYALSLCDPEAPIVLKAHALSKEGNYADAIRAYRSLKQIPESARISYGWDLYRHARQLLEHATLDVVVGQVFSYVSKANPKPACSLIQKWRYQYFVTPPLMLPGSNN